MEVPNTSENARCGIEATFALLMSGRGKVQQSRGFIIDDHTTGAARTSIDAARQAVFPVARIFLLEASHFSGGNIRDPLGGLAIIGPKLKLAGTAHGSEPEPL